MPVRNIRDLLSKYRGVTVTSRVNRVTNGVIAPVTLLMRGDPSRIAFLLVNTDQNQDTFVAPNENVQAVAAIKLAANGGSLSAQWDEDGEVVSLPWSGRILSGGSTMFILELVIEHDVPPAVT